MDTAAEAHIRAIQAQSQGSSDPMGTMARWESLAASRDEVGDLAEHFTFGNQCVGTRCHRKQHFLDDRHIRGAVWYASYGTARLILHDYLCVDEMRLWGSVNSCSLKKIEKNRTSQMRKSSWLLTEEDVCLSTPRRQRGPMAIRHRGIQRQSNQTASRLQIFSVSSGCLCR